MNFRLALFVLGGALVLVAFGGFGFALAEEGWAAAVAGLPIFALLFAAGAVVLLLTLFFARGED